MKNTLVFTWILYLQYNILDHGTFANRKYEQLSYPKNPKMYDPILVTLLKKQPHHSQSSRENATPSSGTSPLTSYKEVTAHVIKAPSAPFLPMGWALKCSRARSARFSTKQKEYLSAKFQIGERTGLKADPASVATAMRKAKDVNGERLFDSTEFLTAQQVARFFSRLAAKKTTDEDTEDDDEDEDHTAHLQRENHLQEMRDNIVTSMSIQNAHPIVYDSFNICELVQKSKLAS